MWILRVQIVTKKLKVLPRVTQKLLLLTQLESKKPVGTPSGRRLERPLETKSLLKNRSGKRLSRKRSNRLISGRRSKTRLELNDWLICSKTKSQKMRTWWRNIWTSELPRQTSITSWTKSTCICKSKWTSSKSGRTRIIKSHRPRIWWSNLKYPSSLLAAKCHLWSRRLLAWIRRASQICQTNGAIPT